MFRYRYLVAAVILAVVGTALTGSYIHELERQATGEGPRVQVVVAKTTISKGTKMQPSLVDSRMWPVAMVPPGAVTQINQVDGQYSLVDLVPGEIILASRLVVQEEQSLVWQLAPGERAVAVSVGGVDGLEAELIPGSRVDILGTLLDYRTGLEHSLLVLENIALLNIVVDENPYGTVLGKRKVVLALSPDQAKKLALFDSSGSLQLLLRPNGASGSHGQSGLALTTKDILGSGEGQGESEGLGYPPADQLSEVIRPLANGRSEKTIEVIRGTAASLETASVKKPFL